MREEFIGGLRLSNPVALSWGANATWPFARLVVDEDGITLSVREPIRRLFRGKWLADFEPVKIAYSELVRVEAIRVRRGIRFHTQSPQGRGRAWDRRNGAIFWTWEMGTVRKALEARGVEFS
ncbi:MAG: hypothetical protein ACRDPA_27690 [Solirubrobacteraceae bacterium]